jgi:hypothetical protein
MCWGEHEGGGPIKQSASGREEQTVATRRYNALQVP